MSKRYYYSTMLNDDVHYISIIVKVHMIRQSNGQKTRHGNLGSILLLFQTKKKGFALNMVSMTFRGLVCLSPSVSYYNNRQDKHFINKVVKWLIS